MTKKNSTAIGVIVDRSGSMASIKQDMEGGINTFIESQKGQVGTCHVTLADFDTDYRIVYDTVNVDAMGKSDYVLDPRGGTALNDSVGRFVTELGASLRNMPESKRPDKVIVVIVTDGYENSSREWSTEAVRKLITQQQDQWSWEFVFLGKDIDSFAQAGAWGIRKESTLDFSNAPVAMASASLYASNSRSGMGYAQNVASTLDNEERRKAAVTPSK